MYRDQNCTLWLPDLQLCNYLVLIILLEKSAKLHCIVQYIYRCMVIQKHQYIDTPKLCIVTSLVLVRVICNCNKLLFLKVASNK